MYGGVFILFLGHTHTPIFYFFWSKAPPSFFLGQRCSHLFGRMSLFSRGPYWAPSMICTLAQLLKPINLVWAQTIIDL